MKRHSIYLAAILMGSMSPLPTLAQQSAPGFVIPKNFGCIVKGMTANFTAGKGGIEIVEGSGSVGAVVCGTKLDNLRDIPLASQTIKAGFLQSKEMGRLQLIVTSNAPPSVEVAFEVDRLPDVMKLLGIGSSN